MRRALALPAALAALALAAPAQAAITPSRDASAVAGAITEQMPLGFAGAGFSTIPPAPGQQTDTDPVAIGDAAPALAGFPTSAPRYAILTTGRSTFADDPNGSPDTGQNNGGGSANESQQEVFDLVSLRIDFSVPVGMSCLRLDVRFLSEEFPEFVGETVNDAFLAELDPDSVWTTDGSGAVDAPDNFAFDTNGSLISINTAEFSAEGAAGTTYDGATPRLRVSTPVTPGRHALHLSVFDQGDAVYDSAAFVDALRLDASPQEACVRGATAVDTTAPAVTVTSPAPSSTVAAAPVFSGSAGNAAGDAGTVALRVFAGSQASGQPAQELTATRSGTSWSVQGGPLAPGTYTVQAQQSDAAGNVGAATSTFTVFTPIIDEPPLPPPPPVTGRAVNVQPVKGIVKVRVPGGKMVRLEDAEQIPTGSVLDTREGTVRLISTGARGTTQNALFFQGLFKVTQTKGSRPMTVLRLTEKLARCKASRGKGKARTSARRRKRRLWGDGSGAFRTSGRRSAATVSGTRWLVEDSCAGTLTKVARGKVKVRDYKRRKTVTVRAGHSYRAR